MGSRCLLVASFVVLIVLIQLNFSRNLPIQVVGNGGNKNQVKLDLGELRSSRKFVVFDLGANNGDSLSNFFGIGENKMYNQLNNEKINQVKWTVYAFEANPYFNGHLAKLGDTLGEHGHTVNMFSSTAAWTHNGTIEFYLDTVNKYHNYWGSSIKKTHPDVVKDKSKITVKCVDIAGLVSQYSEDDFVFIKMDIEGAEYDVIHDFIKKRVLNKIDYMAIEYHPDAINVFTSEDAFNYLIKSEGVRPIKWE